MVVTPFSMTTVCIDALYGPTADSTSDAWSVIGPVPDMVSTPVSVFIMPVTLGPNVMGISAANATGMANTITIIASRIGNILLIDFFINPPLVKLNQT
jgi:hypothetical protein